MPQMTHTRGTTHDTVRLHVPLTDYTRADVERLIGELQQIVAEMEERPVQTIRWEITYKGVNYPDVVDWADIHETEIAKHVEAKLRIRPHHTRAIVRDTTTGRKITITKVA